MLKDAEYIRFPQGEGIVESFLHAIVSLRTEDLEQMLKDFACKKGYALNDDEVVYFASEVPETDPEYFGDSGVAVYRYRPAEDKLTVVLMEEVSFAVLLISVILQHEDLASERCAMLVREIRAWCAAM